MTAGINHNHFKKWFGLKLPKKAAAVEPEIMEKDGLLFIETELGRCEVTRRGARHLAANLRELLKAGKLKGD
jgi:hypothetical protein